jgi:hypothetical protein
VGYVYFEAWKDLAASVSGSRMIVEIRGTDVWTYCFEGTCRFDHGHAEQLTDPGYKQVYHTATGQWENQVKMENDELWNWNVKCNFCMSGIISTPTPTPKPLITNIPVLPTSFKAGNEASISPVPPTAVPPTAVPPTAIPPTAVHPTAIPTFCFSCNS